MSGTGQRRRRLWPFAVGVVEFVALVVVADGIGLGWALVLMLATSVAGLALLRLEGFRAWAALRRTVLDGHLAEESQHEAVEDDPATRMADTGVRILRGVLLTLPGFVTDLMALALLMPPVRRSVGRRLAAAVFRTFDVPRPPARGGAGGTDAEHKVVIEGEVVDSDGDHGRFGRWR